MGEEGSSLTTGVEGDNVSRHIAQIVVPSVNVGPPPSTCGVFIATRKRGGEDGEGGVREREVRDGGFTIAFFFDHADGAFCLLCIVPQYGRLAAIFWLLALNHSACLRNARRISYG